MDPKNTIYSELRNTKLELTDILHKDTCSPLIKPYIEDELHDIESALNKIENGTYGTCEISGELLPKELLNIIPTLKSIDDCKLINYLIKP